jgi:hypothetical protein
MPFPIPVLTGVGGFFVLLSPSPFSEPPPEKETPAQVEAPDPSTMHAELFVEDRFPSATECAQCHPRHFAEWSSSQHAYAQISPVFNAMNGRLLQLQNGTLGDFCIRCHTPVGMVLGEPAFTSNTLRHPVSLEGVTCVVCHRMSDSYGKLSSRFGLEEGDLTRPINGPRGDDSELRRMISESGLITDPEQVGRSVHGGIRPFFDLKTPGFCGICHDVTLSNGFRLEEAFAEYESSPAARKGITCQDCHMGLEPGKVLADRTDPDFERKNYPHGPAATVFGRETAPRRLTSHRFVGPDHSVVPPYVFPVNPRAVSTGEGSPGLATIEEWMEFDIEAGWGTETFEDEVTGDHVFPERWSSIDDRYEAREILDENLESLREVRELRLTLLRNGYLLGEISTLRADPRGLRFQVEVRSGTSGHNVPTGFDAERLVWLHVQVFSPDGTVIKESGDLDPDGDLRDLHSAYVHDHELPLDEELFNLQSKFVTRILRGGERERVLSVATSASVLPFLRPERRSSILQGGPRGARKHKKGIEPGGRRTPVYTVDEKALQGPGEYRIRVALKAAMVPVNLVREIAEVGFDYGLSPRAIARELIQNHLVLHEREIVVRVPDKERDRR